MPSLHNTNYVVSFIKMLTSQKSEALDLLSVDFAAFHCVNSRRVDTTVSENIGKAHDVLLQAVIGACEEVPQVVRKDLLLRYLRRLTQFLHIVPNVRSVKRFSVLCHENGAAFYFLLFCVPL